MTAETTDPEPPDHQHALYHSPIGLFDFQADRIARSYWQWSQTDEPVGLALWETGTGKSHLAMASVAMAVEDGLADQIVVVAEANKALDWVEDDFPRFTSLPVEHYAGAVAKRRKMLAQPPQVLVMSYETSRNDLANFRPRSRSVAAPGMLSEFLRGKRVALIFDEFSRLRTRTSKTYLAWNYALSKVLRAGRTQPLVLGLTATTVERSPEDHFNAGRLLAPWRACSVEEFYRTYVQSYDHFGNPARWHNLTAEETPAGVLPLNQMFAPITTRVRKTDPEVMAQFPAKMENPPEMVDLAPAHRSAYDQVEAIFAADDLSDQDRRVGFGLLRQLAGHPLALLGSEGVFAQEVVAGFGAQVLEQMAVAKVEAMLRWQERMDTQQTVIFTFYGRSVLPHLAHALRGAGHTVSINHGGLSPAERKVQQDAYKAGDTQVFLSSDAGARGLNLGVGSGLLHYEAPLLYSIFDQRSNRIHRVDSVHPSVTVDHLVARDTVEVPIAHIMLRRAEWAEKVQESDYSEDRDPSETHLRAADRLALLRRAS